MRRVYTEKQVAAARDAARNGWTLTQISDVSGIARSALPPILRGDTYRDVSGALSAAEYQSIIRLRSGVFVPAVARPDPIPTSPDEVIAEEVRSLAARHRRTPQDIRDIARAYRLSRDIHGVARGLGIPWPTVHAVVFDLRRAGLDPPRREKRMAA